MNRHAELIDLAIQYTYGFFEGRQEYMCLALDELVDLDLASSVEVDQLISLIGKRICSLYFDGKLTTLRAALWHQGVIPRGEDGPEQLLKWYQDLSAELKKSDS